MGGHYGKNVYVDIPNIFRDFDADENDPDSYDFAFTDALILDLDKAKVKPIYRLGVSIENARNIKAYRIYPPKDYGKWARICEHIILHYNEGWANGYHIGIEYWEIWNEPDNQEKDSLSPMWIGTAEQYYELYTVAAKHLKACFGDKIKVGGYAACGFMGILFPRGDDRFWSQHYWLDFFEGFFKYIKENDAPIDFFSWHSYLDLKYTVQLADYLEERLDYYGYSGLETQINEWNNGFQPDVTRGTSLAAANAAAMMIAFQHKKTKILCYYDAAISHSPYAGLFNPITYEPFCTYYSFKAFGELYSMGTEAQSSVDGEGLYALAAVNGEKKAVLISNISENSVEIKNDLPSDMKVYLIDEDHFMTEEGNITPTLTLKTNQVAYIK